MIYLLVDAERKVVCGQVHKSITVISEPPIALLLFPLPYEHDDDTYAGESTKFWFQFLFLGFRLCVRL